MSNGSFHEQLRRQNSRFDELLRDLARLLTPEDAATLIERKFCRLDGVAVELRLNDHLGLIGLYIELCRPQPAQELEVCRRALEAQASQGTPANWLVGRHPSSGALVIVAHVGLEAVSPGHAGELMHYIEGGTRIASGFGKALLDGL
jgi:hypothetical protein